MWTPAEDDLMSLTAIGGNAQRGQGAFTTTHWSVALEAQGESPAAQEALEKLCRTYWRPVYSFVRRQGAGAEDAEDFTQGFFALVLERKDLSTVRKKKGRLRSYLLTSVKNFLADEARRALAVKRGKCQRPISLDEIREGEFIDLERSDGLTADQIYERRWAFTVLEQVMARLRDEYRSAGHLRFFEQMKKTLMDEPGRPSQAQIAKEFDMTENAVKQAFYRFRQRYQTLLREEIAHTVAMPSAIEDELRDLIAAALRASSAPVGSPIMISTLKVCPKCGWEIPADAPEGGCPGCLLQSGLKLLGDEGRRALPPRQHAPTSERPVEMLGELGDYRLLEEVGRGGQGVVFRARQKSLNRTVALKVISLGQWASEAHLKRFRREAEAAASLDHPAIVPIYEVGEHEGSCYFSMKFIDGGQLDAVVKREPMSVRQAAELVAKVARTVHYAHEHGIVHRDIKPGNILLDGKGEPSLTDFGLARLVEADSTVTGTLEVLGTPSYMAPEQAAGEHTKVSKATDVYGLGAVLFQLLTGQPPFAGETTYETIRLLRDTEPRPPRLLNPKVDRDLSTICLKCLEKDPTRRYSSALAVAEDLEHWLNHEPIQAHSTGIFARGRKWVRRQPAIAALVASSVALAAVMGWNIWKSVIISAPATKGIAVLPFENLSPDPDNAYFAEGIQDEILTRLANIADLRVISRTSTQHYHSKPGNLGQIAKQLGVANILEGSVQKAADQVRVNVQLINAQTDSHLWADSYDQKLTDILGVESEIAKAVADQLQAKLTGQEKHVITATPTDNIEAYDAYLRGLAFQARGVSFDPPNTDLVTEAAGFYERAVQLDPNFALAWSRLSRADALLYHSGISPTARRDAAKRASENAQKLEPNSPETLLALGYYQYWGLHDYVTAKTTFARVNKMLPGNSEAPWALGLITRRQGRWDESIADFERALSLDPRSTGLLSETALTYGMLRQFPAALKLYDRALDIAPNDLDVMAAKAGIYQAQGNLQEAARLLSGINEQTHSEASFAIKITQLQLERNYSDAIRLYEARLAQHDFKSEVLKGFNQVKLAIAHRLAGDTARAKATAEQGRNTLEPLYRNQPDSVYIAAVLSQPYAVLGEKDLALKVAERAIMLLPRTKDAVAGPTFEENLAFIETIVGENSQAILTLTQLLQTPYKGSNYVSTPVTPALLGLDPLWDPLRADPAFQKLCEEKQK
jgi:RNA polymerase sigma factor (sigma-70 family)